MDGIADVVDVDPAIFLVQRQGACREYVSPRTVSGEGPGAIERPAQWRRINRIIDNPVHKAGDSACYADGSLCGKPSGGSREENRPSVFEGGRGVKQAAGQDAPSAGQNAPGRGH